MVKILLSSIVVFHLFLFAPIRPVLSKFCSQNDHQEKFCNENGKSDLEKFNQQMKFMSEGHELLSLLFIIEPGKGAEKLTSLNVQQSAEWLLRQVEYYPQISGFIGVGISIWSLYDSFPGNQEIQDVKDEFEHLMKTKQETFKEPKVYLLHMFTRSKQIQKRIQRIQSWQWKAAALKGVAAGVLGWIGYSTSAAPLKAFSYLSCSLNGMAGIIHLYNWGQLKQLVDKLDQSGHLS